jgi:hypothetical protein
VEIISSAIIINGANVRFTGHEQLMVVLFVTGIFNDSVGN